jgi:hypothetical protein
VGNISVIRATIVYTQYLLLYDNRLESLWKSLAIHNNKIESNDGYLIFKIGLIIRDHIVTYDNTVVKLALFDNMKVLMKADLKLIKDCTHRTVFLPLDK